MKLKYLLFVCVQMMFFSACSDDDKASTVIVDDSFNSSLHEWIADFADYPTNASDSVFYELEHGHAFLPEPLDKTQKALMISGNNHSDDLFMFAKKRIKGLKANQEYEASFEVELASNAASNSMGVGGAPGESVYFGIGLTTVEPVKVADEQGYYRMNIKKMNQSQDGEEMKVIGNVANGTEKNEYTLIKRTGTFNVKTGEKGEAWAIVGTDSGFEATTTLYYTRIKIVFTPLNQE